MAGSHYIILIYEGEVDHMKKFFSGFTVLIMTLLAGVVLVPWNDLSQWGVGYAVLADNEITIKLAVAGLAFLLGLIGLIVSLRQYKRYGHVKRETNNITVLPMLAVAGAGLLYAAAMMAFVYQRDATQGNQLLMYGYAAIAVNVIVFAHILVPAMRKTANKVRIALFILLVEILALGAGSIYYLITFKMTDYASFYTYNYILAVPIAFVLWLIHVIVMAIRSKRHKEEKALEDEIDDIRSGQNKGSDLKPLPKQGNKTMVVSKSETIVSGEEDLDPTQMVYEDVEVDPEFVKTSNKDKQVSSIEYYIDKPSVSKPLDPTFDQLVEDIRKMPGVVTKIQDEKITFYADQQPFLVLMNYGNYYRMAFKYELEKGIRLIIKYPTISKNKSTQDELWFKANNYGDIPKEVIYDIVRNAHQNAGA